MRMDGAQHNLNIRKNENENYINNKNENEYMQNNIIYS